ncbi:MAG: hypothetical protein GY947_19915 [Rhodobacteraceae bacterium]|nr:hypothetical protein [Paracoccaceae bacterium]
MGSKRAPISTRPCNPKSATPHTRKLAAYCNAGAEAVYPEAYERFDGPNPHEDLICRQSVEFQPETLIFELPVAVPPGTTRDIKHQVAAGMYPARTGR